MKKVIIILFIIVVIVFAPIVKVKRVAYCSQFNCPQYTFVPILKYVMHQINPSGWRWAY
jgi:hypothetical protein